MSSAPAATSNPASSDIVRSLAAELGLALAQVQAVVRLLGEGATVPFIARYRKEHTGGLDEVQIRSIGERFEYLTELAERRRAIVDEIRAQGKLTSELEARLLAAATKAELEDLYLPYRPKKQTRASIAVERGLAPLAELMWRQDESEPPEVAAARFVKPDQQVADVAAALAGARDICIERLAEDAELRKHLREAYFEHGVIKVGKRMELEGKPTKFDMYANYEEPVHKVPSHRFLAIRRGESEEVLFARVMLDFEPHLAYVRGRIPLRAGTRWAAELERVVSEALSQKLGPQVAAQVRVELKLRSDRDAISVFAQNLGELLLAPPFGGHVVLGIDPGQRTGCKCAVVDGTGRLLEHATLYLVQGDSALAQAKQIVLRLCRAHGVRAVAVGNGTHGRETEAFVRGVLAEASLASSVICVSVNEAGASVYSASEVARVEFPDLDLTVRGAVSIARRLQDPLAELVKIDPKSIGVGQYQHDVSQSALDRKLNEVVESCVNRVGVELNTASAELLSRVAGIGPGVARRIVSHRDQHGRFRSRQALLDVSGVGPKTFEQAAGFLRIREGEHPLDASAVHPERYALVERMARDLGVPVSAIVGSAALLRRLDLSKYKQGDVGDFTLNDILAELDKPGRDPRSTFEAPKFRDDVRELADLKPGMVLEGVVTNITAFGAFVDVGVHQDGLVHISELADRFVKDPHSIVKVGTKLSVRVLEVDLARRRIALSARRGSSAAPASDASGAGGPARPQAQGGSRREREGRSGARGGAPAKKSSQTTGRDSPRQRATFQNNPFAELLKKG